MPPLPSSLRLLIIGGEKASDEAFRRWKRQVGGTITLMNGYGATEATVTSTLHVVRPEDHLQIAHAEALQMVA